MDVFGITFQAIFTLLGIGVLGFWIIGRRRVASGTLAFLSSLAIDIALPFLVITNLISDFSPQGYPNWWHMPVWWLGFTIVALALSLATSFLVKKDIRSEFTIGLFYQNGLFFPLLIIGGLFGQGNSYLVALFLFMMLFPSMVFGTYPLFFARNVQKEKLNLRRVVNPVLIATVVGLLIGLVAVQKHIPDFLLSVFAMVGAMAMPLFMLILGGNVYNDFMYQGNVKSELRIREISKFVLIKNVLFPCVFLALLVWIRPDYSVALIVMLQAMVPPITAIPILAERCQGDRKIASQFVVASFIFSLISIPAFIYVFSRFFPVPLG
jgi:malate permease and related proteins